MENKDKLKVKINEMTDNAIDRAVIDGSLEHFEIEIKLHQKYIQMNSISKTRDRVY